MVGKINFSPNFFYLEVVMATKKSNKEAFTAAEIKELKKHLSWHSP